MSLFRTLSMWGLRGLALWGAFELAAGAYADVSEQTSALARINAHRAVMQRLDTRAAALESQASVAGRQMATLNGHADFETAPGRPSGDQIGPVLREELMALGAQAPIVEISEAALGSELRRIRIKASWREAQATSPSMLSAIAQRHPGLSLRALRLERVDGAGFVETELEVEGLVRERRAVP